MVRAFDHIGLHVAVVCLKPTDFLVLTSFAGNGVDYETIAAASVTFQPGETTKSFSFTLTDDSVVERDENLRVTITSASGATIGTPNEATVTIQNNDCKNCFLAFLLLLLERE